VAPAACLLCESPRTTPVVRLERVPALTNTFWPSAEAAREAPRGTVALVACHDCGLLANVAFRGDLASYDPGYDNSIHFSAVFQAYVDELVTRLIGRHDLRDKRVVEIGCGSGDFLAALCRAGGNHGVGFDPSHDVRRRPPAGGDVVIRAEPFPAQGLVADLVVARHVLEHVADPGRFLRSIRAALGEGSEAVLYFEVPNAAAMLEHEAIWEVIHEHCTYFTRASLDLAFRRAGFLPERTGTALDGQYLWIEARVNGRGTDPPAPARCEVLPAEAVAAFGRAFEHRRRRWRRRLAHRGHEHVAVWGAGAKGVMFLNLVDPDGRIPTVVDVNPHKQGRHVPATGQVIMAPGDLGARPPAEVIVMNPVFEDEIRATLVSHGIDAEISVA